MAKIDPASMEKTLLQMPQVECKVAHYFGPGIYIREVTIPAGTLAVGHMQKFEHLNILLKGSVAMIMDGEVKVVNAPLIFTGKPGRKFGYALEETVWQNIYATEETDVEKLEEMFVEKSQEWLEHHADQADYTLLVSGLNMSQEQIRSQVENNDDIVHVIPEDKARLGDSKIHGTGVFSVVEISMGEVIGPARIGGKRTYLGRYTNHSVSPNCFFEHDKNGIAMIAAKRIKAGDEITVCYRQALSLSGVNS